MLLSFKTQLKPNNKQITLFRQHCGVARHAYNFGNDAIVQALEARQADKTVKVPGSIDLHKRLVAEIKVKNPWYYEVSKASPQQALRDVVTAWDRCFKKVSSRPKFKKKGKSHDSFYLEQGYKASPAKEAVIEVIAQPKTASSKAIKAVKAQPSKLATKGQAGIKAEKKRVKLPKIGWVRLHEPLPISGFYSCVISRTADDWFIAIKYEVELPVVALNRPTVGVDIGIKELAVTSDGKVFQNPKAYRRMSKKMKQLQRSVSRKVRGSSNRTKAVRKLAKLHQRVTNIRKDAIHKLTHHLAKNHSVVKIEDLHVNAFLKNHKLAGAIADCGMYEFKRQLEYKTIKFGSELILVDRWFPSSQICSKCTTHRHKMPLKNRVYVCPDCGHTEDRDLNAAKNIDRWFEGIHVPDRSN